MISRLKKPVKETIKKLFALFGLKISRLPKRIKSGQLVKAKIGKFNLWLYSEHQLPIYLENLPYYSKNLPRLAVAVMEKYPDLKMIDVGANVGDTVALTRSLVDFPITCIEGDPDFYKILKMNLENFNQAQAYQAFLGEKKQTIKAGLQKNLETSRLDQSFSFARQEIELNTLDDFIKEHPTVGKSKLLKIDTDGYDLKVIKGGLEYIYQTKPIIFLEYDTVFFDEQGDDALTVLKQLEDYGYQDAIFYDNIGKLIVSTKLFEHRQIIQLHNYVDKKTRTPFPYYDLVLFHNEDCDLAERFINQETALFKQ